MLRPAVWSRKVQSLDASVTWQREWEPEGKGAEWDHDDQLEVQWRPAPKNELPVKTVSV